MGRPAKSRILVPRGLGDRFGGIGGSVVRPPRRLWPRIPAGLNEGSYRKTNLAPLILHDESCRGNSGDMNRAAAGCTISTGIRWPILQMGHRVRSRSPVFPSPLALLAAPVSVGVTPSNARQRASFFLRARFARKPNCRMRTKPPGSTWRRKRRMNSTASSVIVRVSLPPA